MKEKIYIKQLEDRLHELVIMLTDHSTYSVLSDTERKKLSNILLKTCEARREFKTA